MLNARKDGVEGPHFGRAMESSTREMIAQSGIECAALIMMD